MAETDDTALLAGLLDRLEGLLAAVDELAPADRELVVDLLDRVDDLHRLALLRLGQQLSPATIEDLRAAHPAVAWLWEAYGVGLDARTLARRSLDDVRPYLASHGGDVELVDVDDGVVTVRLTGACNGCTASALTLRDGVERALAEGFPDFERLEVEHDPDAEPHPPPGEVLLQLEPWPGGTSAT